MTSAAGQLIPAPRPGRAREGSVTELRGRRVRFGVESSTRADVAGAALVLGSTLALWAAFVLAVR